MASTGSMPIAAVMGVSLPTTEEEPLWTFKLWDGSLKVSRQNDIWSDPKFQAFVVTMMTSITLGFDGLVSQLDMPQAHVQQTESNDQGVFDLTAPIGQTMDVDHMAVNDYNNAHEHDVLTLNCALPTTNNALMPFPTHMSIDQELFEPAIPMSQTMDLEHMALEKYNVAHGHDALALDATFAAFNSAMMPISTNMSNTQGLFDFTIPIDQMMDDNHKGAGDYNTAHGHDALALESAFTTPNPARHSMTPQKDTSMPSSPPPAPNAEQDADTEGETPSTITADIPSTPCPTHTRQHHFLGSSLEPRTPQQSHPSPLCPGAPKRKPTMFLTKTDADVRRSLRTAAKRGLHWRSTIGR